MNQTATSVCNDAGGSGRIDRHFLRRGYGVEFEMERDWVRRHLPPGLGLVADIGCGIGGLFPAIELPRVIGVDYRADGLTHTRSRFPTASLLCADAGRLPFMDASLDAITLQHVVEHIPACRTACGEWLRVLKPGGMLLILTPNRSFNDPSVYDDDTHIYLFDQADLCEVLLGSGFEVLDLRTLGLGWFRAYHGIPSGWRLRRGVTRYARALSGVPGWRWKGQTLCCAARKPIR